MKPSIALGIASCISGLLIAACEEKPANQAPKPPPKASTPAPPAETHDHGATTQLGEQTVSGYTIKATRDGEVKAGGEAAVDVWVTPAAGSAKVSAVRFWIGSQDGAGSIKARAEIEGDHWHTHAEVPNPIPAGSKLWVEVEAEGGQKHIAGFDLKS